MMLFILIIAAIFIAMMLIGVIISLFKLLFIIGLIAFVIAVGISLARKVTRGRAS